MPLTEQQQADLLTEFMLKNGIKRCLCCQASMGKSTHRMTKVLVTSLVKMARGVAIKHENDIRVDKLPNDLALTHIERCNFHKLRMHGLIARVKIEGTVKRGRWLITRRGWQFIQGNENIPSFVQSFRNKVVSHSDQLVSVKDVLGESPYCENISDQYFDIVGDEDLSVVVQHYTGRKKRKNPCPACQGGQLKPRLNVTAFSAEGTVSTVTTYHCNACSYESPLARNQKPTAQYSGLGPQKQKLYPFKD